MEPSKIQDIIPIAMEAPAQTELKHFRSGELSPFQKALSSPAVRMAPEESLKEVLRYAMLLVGIRSQNMPDGLEKAVLLQFLRNTYGGHKTEEIRMAFDKAVAGDLDLGKEGAKCFENFSCEYIGRIMAAYRKWASLQAEEFDPLPVDETPALPPAGYDPMHLVDMFYQEYLSGTLNLDTVTERAYQIASEKYELVASEEAALRIVAEAREYVLNKYSERLKTMAKEKAARAFYDLRSKKAALESMPVGESCNDGYVNRFAKALALKHWFAQQEKNNIKSLNEL